jgi:hypothetical protein
MRRTHRLLLPTVLAAISRVEITSSAGERLARRLRAIRRLAWFQHRPGGRSAPSRGRTLVAEGLGARASGPHNGANG